MMAWAGAFDDEPQPRTLAGWIARQRRDLMLMRCASHAKLDEMFDEHERQIAQDVQRIEVDAELGSASRR